MGQLQFAFSGNAEPEQNPESMPIKALVDLAIANGWMTRADLAACWRQMEIGEPDGNKFVRFEDWTNTIEGDTDRWLRGTILRMKNERESVGPAIRGAANALWGQNRIALFNALRTKKPR